MYVLKITALTVMGLSVSGCGEALLTTFNVEGGNRTGAERFVDAGRDEKSLIPLVAGIWLTRTGVTTGSSTMDRGLLVRASDTRWSPCLFRYRTAIHSCWSVQPRYGHS